MPREVKPDDFTDQQIDAFFDSVKEVRWSSVEPVPEWVQKEAQAFAQRKPRPTPDELRLHVGHSVVVARGWDHPHDRELIFTSAVKSYYLIAWLEHLQRRLAPSGEDAPPVELSLAMKVSFTPVTPRRAEGRFHGEGEEGKAASAG